MFLKIKESRFINLDRVDKIIIPNMGIYTIRFVMGSNEEKLMFKTEKERQSFIEKNLKSIIG
ncbi:hypothetical protein [Clostridium kluyveri]|uniref:Uncharacterized protein n=1 Tax=Clostridium kluyveri TaxID=1534 RepID=A0A1L5F367_CLOKL|nr:hypothetical protein [Clostridium kluyveri]APM37300.1 hypothetical protein BS101_00235 [Clostridium kluyveri]